MWQGLKVDMAYCKSQARTYPLLFHTAATRGSKGFLLKHPESVNRIEQWLIDIPNSHFRSQLHNAVEGDVQQQADLPFMFHNTTVILAKPTTTNNPYDPFR